MNEIPKVVRARLGQKGAADPESLHGASHPDANLLSGFIEQSLGERERTAVLSHLADCRECRELVALVSPTTEAEPAVAEASGSATSGFARWPEWLSWRALRWGVLAASVGVVMVGAFRTRTLRWPSAQNTREATVAENHPVPSVVGPGSPAPSSSSQTQTLPAPPAAAAPAERAQARTSPAMADSLKRAEVPVPTAQYRARSNTRLNKKAALAGAAGGTVSRDEEAAKRGASELDKARAKDSRVPVPKELRAGATAGRPGATNATGVGVTASEVSAGAFKVADGNKLTARRRDLDKKLPPVSEAVAVQGQAAAPPKKSNERAAEQGLVQAMAPPPPGAQQSKEQRPASGLGLQAQTQVEAGVRQKTAGVAANQIRQIQRAALPAHLSISASGKILRSAAIKGPWTELSVDDSVRFRAIAADGSDVWAGGSGGALYHSTDSGDHWTRVKVGPNRTDDEAAVSDAIVGIRFTDREHGMVTTEAHQTWFTADGGAHWTMQPSSQ